MIIALEVDFWCQSLP